VVVILVAGILGAAVLFTDDEPQASGDDRRTAATESDGVGDDGDDETATTIATGSVLGGLDPGAPGGLGGDSAVQLEPLPGSDWSEQARVRFVDDCTTHLGANMSAVGADPSDVCGCIYDDVSATSDFAAFNEQWTGEVDPGSEVGQNLTNAVLSCSLAATG
jgi:hypothetical protein